MTRQAWITARLITPSTVRLPRLETLMQREDRPTPQTPDQMLTIVRAMNAAMGGAVKTK